MTQITIINILDKIRSICKDSDFGVLPERATSETSLPPLEGYLKALECVRLEFIAHRSLQDEYSKLQQLLQRQETDIRKRIGIENQLKLYSDTLKTQLEDLQREKMDLLENTKTYIKQLKQTNENLFIELNLQINKHKLVSSNKSHQKSISKSRQVSSKVSRFNRSHSHHNRSKGDKSIKQIVKTEYIERQGSPSRKVDHQHSKRQVHETISDTQGEQLLVAKQNSRTEHIIRNSSKKEKGSHLASKKKANHIFSNPNFYSFFESSKKKPKKEQKDLFGKSARKEKKEKKNLIKSRVQNPSRCLWKEKQLNRSVYSVLSMDHPSSQKETI